MRRREERKKKINYFDKLRLDLKIIRLPSPDRPNTGGADTKCVSKRNFFFFEFFKHFLRQQIILTLSFTFQMHVYILLNLYFTSLDKILKQQTCGVTFQSVVFVT